MKQQVFGQAPQPGQEIPWIMNALRSIERASREDIEGIFDGLTIIGSYPDTRTLEPSTATVATLAAFVATFVTDIKKRGPNRNYDEV